MKQDKNTLLDYYLEELNYLHNAGAEFAEKYPKIAKRLEIGGDKSSDPHVERMIESFAFLTGRLQKNIDDEFNKTANSLLDIIYPNYLKPVPSMSVASFECNPVKGKFSSGIKIERHTMLYAKSSTSEEVRFRTCYPLTLWPLLVDDAKIESPDNYSLPAVYKDLPAILNLKICGDRTDLDELDFASLRFHLNGSSAITSKLYEMLLCNLEAIAIQPENSDKLRFLPKGSFNPVGFKKDEEVIPYQENGFSGYRLLQEYFTFPEKFFFFDVHNLNSHGSVNSFNLLFFFNRFSRDLPKIGRKNFLLNCTPVINLFDKTSEPLNIDHTKSEYLLISDNRKRNYCEIHTVKKVIGIKETADEPVNMRQFFSYDGSQKPGKGKDVYWFAKRKEANISGISGSEIYLNFTDTSLNPFKPGQDLMVYAETLSTNRQLAANLHAGAVLNLEIEVPVSLIQLTIKPTKQINPSITGESYKNLISNLALNYLSLTADRQGLTALKEILKLYCYSDKASSLQQIEGLVRLESCKIVRRIGKDTWKGFCRGTKITLTFSEEKFVGSTPVLLGAVLNNFLALYTSINSFVQLDIKTQQQEGILKSWNPISGEQEIL